MQIRRVILTIFDLLSFFLAFAFSLFIRQSTLITDHFGFIHFDIVAYLIYFIIASVFLLTIFGAFKLYQVREIEMSARIFTILKALAFWIFTLATLMYVSKFDFSRGIFFMTVSLTAIFIVIFRFIIFKRKQKQLSKSNTEPEAIIIGTGDRADSIEKSIKNSLPNTSIIKLNLNEPSALNYLISYKPTDIILADESLTREEVLSVIADDRFSHHSFRVVLDVFKLVTGEVRLNDIDEIPSINPRKEPNTVYLISKRAFDILFSTIGIIITAPLWLIICLAIKLDPNSKGPIFLKQTRCGWNGTPFVVFKFRTMHCDAPLYGFAPQNSNDSRITSVGKLLRRLSLDELPQLLNILKGDMSLVGPRPEMEFIVNNYTPWQRLRLNTKPGLTGLWQILGRKDIPLHKNLEYDFYYVSNRNFLLDFTIILKTIPAVLFGRGAY